MNKIFLNNDVWNRYVSGRKLNNAIYDVFGEEIEERVKNNKSLENMNPIQIVMHDAGITGDSFLQSMINPKNISNSAYTSGGMETNQWLFPAWVETTLREAIYEKSMLQYLVSTSVGIEGNTVQSPMLDLMSTENKKAIKKARIAELADIPTGKISIGERAITLWKHGRAIELSYEAARRTKIDVFNIQMRATAGDLARQEEDSALDVAINGDGNNNAASSLGTTEAANTITATDIINAIFDYEDENHFYPDTIVLPQKYFLNVAQMTYDPTLALGASLQITFNTPQISGKNLTLLRKKDLSIGGKDSFLLMNREYSLIRYEENGSNIQEMDNFIRNQRKLMTLTENSGYAVNVNGASRYVQVKSA